MNDFNNKISDLFKDAEKDNIAYSKLENILDKILDGEENKEDVYLFLDLLHLSSVSKVIAKNNNNDYWTSKIAYIVEKYNFHTGQLLWQRTQRYKEKTLFINIDGENKEAITYNKFGNDLILASKAIDSLSDNNTITVGILSFNQYKNVDIIDIGCESSRPGANPLPEKDELDRLAGFLYYITKIEKTLSIDTYKPAVARFALENGFNMINDINGGGENGEMFEIAAEYDCPIVVMHMKGRPSNMQDEPFYDDIIEELLYYFEMKLNLAKAIGLDDEQIILDPGIGFGKRINDNDVILNRISDLKQFGYPILIGLSRKSFLCTDDDSAEDRLPATLGATAIAINNGADIIRVHDVDETYKMTAVISRILQYRNKNEQAN